MAFEKADTDAYGDTHAKAYHRIEKGEFEWLYGRVGVKFTVFAYRIKADADAAKPPINQRDYRLSLGAELVDKTEVNLEKAYEAIKVSAQNDGFFTDAKDILEAAAIPMEPR